MMISPLISLHDLPPPPPGRTGFPWTEGTSRLPQTLPGGHPYPKITVVTPSYQQGRYLEETIRSVLLQNYPNLEYIIIDGGSSDESVEIIQKYAPFLTYWVSEPDGGQTQAINKGFARSTGVIMGWLNSDDLLLPGALYQIARAFCDPKVSLVTGLRKILNETSEITGNFIRDLPGDSYYLVHYCTLAQETTYWRREVWNHLGCLDEQMQFAMDYEYWLRALKRGGYSFHLIPHYLGGFRNYPQNKSNSWLAVYQQDMETLYQRYEMGANETEIHHRLGQRWAKRYDLYCRISRQHWTNYPALVQLSWRVLEIPHICDGILALDQFITYYHHLHEAERLTKFQAVRASLKAAQAALRARLFRKTPQTLPRWGELDLLPSAANFDPATIDTLVLESGWLPLEVHGGESFQWSQGESTIIINNRSPAPRKLRLEIMPAQPDPANLLEWGRTPKTTIERIPITGERAALILDVATGLGNPVRYHLRWQGKVYQERSVNGRLLAFRMLRLGWETPATQVAFTVESLNHVVAGSQLFKQLQRLPWLNPLITVFRDWQKSTTIMSILRDFWTQLYISQTTLETLLKQQELTLHPLRILIDTRAADLNNQGQQTFLVVFLHHLRERYPRALLQVLTTNSDVLQDLDPTVEPIMMAFEQPMGNSEPGFTLTPYYSLETALRRADAKTYWQIIAETHPDMAQAGLCWQQAIHEADVVILAGGHFTDQLVRPALDGLATLDEACYRGLPAFLVGGHFETIINADLLALAQSVLPRLTIPEKLLPHDVSAAFDLSDYSLGLVENALIEAAYRARPIKLGMGIGMHNVAPVSQIVYQFAAEKDGPLLVLNAEAKPSFYSLLLQLSACRLIVTSTYEVTVLALAMGIPAVCLTDDQQRFSRLLAAFDAAPQQHIFALDATENETRLLAVIKEAWEQAPDEQPKLLAAAEAHIQHGRQTYEKLFFAIEQHLAQPPSLPSQSQGVDLPEEYRQAISDLMADFTTLQKRLHENEHRVQQLLNDIESVIEGTMPEASTGQK